MKGATVVVNAGPEETRVAVLEDGKIAEILIERAADRSLVGNVYLGRVDRVLPGMQSAFVDLGLERHAFLHVFDVVARRAEDEAPRGNEALGLEPEPGEDAVPAAPAASPEPRIQDLLRAGQEIIVQVTREPMGHKGARITTHVSFPGKHVVYMPLSDHLGVSKRIEDEPAREALRATLEGLRGRIPGGAIARTDAAGHPPEEIAAELGRLVERWAAIQAAASSARAPACLHREPGLAVRVVRDARAANVARIVVDEDRALAEVEAYVREQAPELAAALQRHPGPGGAFEDLGLEGEIDKALRDRAWLKSGGTLIINQLEALVAIDVNTGKFTGGKGLEDTVLQTNLEAAREVARQLRLRDLGGIIVVDFIDMADPGHRRQVLDALNAALARDRAKTTVLGMSDFGLVEITRQRRFKSLERTLLQACPYCHGSGRIRSAETVVNAALRAVRARAVPGREVIVRVHPDLAGPLRARETALRETGEALPARLRVIEEPDRHRNTFDLSS